MNNGRLYYWMDRSLALVTHRHTADIGGEVKTSAIKQVSLAHEQEKNKEFIQMTEIRRWLRAPR